MLALFHKRRFNRQQRKQETPAATATAVTARALPATPAPAPATSASLVPDAAALAAMDGVTARRRGGLRRRRRSGRLVHGTGAASEPGDTGALLEARRVPRVRSNRGSPRRRSVARAGRITAIVGPNGAGKTTLCSVAAGLLEARTGEVILDGDDITSLPAHARAGKGLMLAPSDRAVFPGLSVEENLAVRLAPGRTCARVRRLSLLRHPQAPACRPSLGR